jgi:hypothetical protein
MNLAGTNNFKVFNEAFSNAQTDAEYNADTARINGLSAGMANLNLHNKLFRQVSVMTAAIGQFIANKGNNASDTDIVALTQAFESSVQGINQIGVDPFITSMLGQ